MRLGRSGSHGRTETRGRFWVDFGHSERMSLKEEDKYVRLRPLTLRLHRITFHGQTRLNIRRRATLSTYIHPGPHTSLNKIPANNEALHEEDLARSNFHPKRFAGLLNGPASEYIIEGEMTEI